tara:strand:- start:302 stop:724 length:423 start_codon:yes stop_codon:yes gene_type:complete
MAEVRTKKTFEKICQDFAGQKTADAPFKNFMSFFVACAAIGVRERAKIPFAGQAGVIVQDRLWEGSNNHDYERNIYAVALFEAKDVSIFSDKEKCYEIFESYVNGGLDYIKELHTEMNSVDATYENLIQDAAHQALENSS